MEEMPELCHRCHAELPEPSPRVDAALFCPYCSAPQLRLPDYMRVEAVAPNDADANSERPATTPGINWHAVLPAALLVALVGALIAVLGLKLPFLAAISPVWVLVSGSLVLKAYLRRHPNALLDAKTGWRLGIVTGVLLVGARGVALAGVGMTARFVTHNMAAYDAETARDAEAGRQISMNMLPADAREDKAFLAHYRALLASPEIKAGTTLVMAGLQGGFVVLFAGLGGMFAGTLEMRRRVLSGRR